MSVAPTPRLEGDALVLEFRGWAMLAAVRRRERIPSTAIATATAGDFTRRPRALKLAGYGGTRRKAGLFRRDGERMLLAFDSPDDVVMLELEPGCAPWRRVVFGADDAAGLAAELARRSSRG